MGSFVFPVYLYCFAIDAIRIKNLRLLEDTGFIELRPITLLLGANNSGKSTFLRSFPLLRQSVESRANTPILWYGRFVDFGSFDQAVNDLDPSNKEISFAYKFTIPKNETDTYFTDKYEEIEIYIELNIVKTRESAGNFIKSIKLSFADHKILIEIDERFEITEFMVNDSSFYEKNTTVKAIYREGLIPSLYEKVSSSIDNEIRELSYGYIRLNYVPSLCNYLLTTAKDILGCPIVSKLLRS